MRRMWSVWVVSTLVLAGCDLSGGADTDGATDGMSGGEDGPDAGPLGGSGGDASGGGDEVPANAYCEDAASWGADMTEFEEEVLVLVNEARAAGASCGGQAFGSTGPLSMNPALRCAARVHSKDMSDRNYFDHVNPEGEDPFVRMGYAGYSYFTAGENIAAGQPSPEEVVQGWMESPGHCSNIMNPEFADIGVGAFSGMGAAYSIYWTQTFGAQ